MNCRSTLLVAAALLFAAAAPAWAYIDPGTGSLLVQSALAIIAGMLVAGRSAWDKIKSFFARRKNNAVNREA